MEFIGRTVELPDGTTRDEFVARCSTHNWFYKGQPPVTHGCSDCWLTYYACQLAMSSGDKYENFQQLESAIRHMAETINKGDWDFKPEFKIEDISHEN